LTNPDYFKIYLEKSKKHKFRPDAVQEIIRYLLVCGHIELTDEHLAMMGDKEFHLSAEHVPEKFRTQAVELYERDPWAGEYYEEHEVKQIDVENYELESVRFKEGKLIEFRMAVTRNIQVITTFDYEVKPDPELVPYYECFRDMHPGNRVKQEWEKANTCPHCGYVAEEREGCSEMYPDGSCQIMLSGNGENGSCCGKPYYVVKPKVK